MGETQFTFHHFKILEYDRIRISYYDRIIIETDFSDLQSYYDDIFIKFLAFNNVCEKWVYVTGCG